MATSDPIQISGLREFQKALKDMDGESQKQLRLVLNDAVEMVAATARPRIPVGTGRARNSLRPSSSQREARVAAGGARVAYYGFLDFGGRVGPGRTGKNTGSVRRPFIKEGRYIYPAYYSVKPKVQARLEEGLRDLARNAGLDVTTDGP